MFDVIRKNSFIANTYSFSGDASDQFEYFTNPDFYFQKNWKITYSFETMHKITDKTFKNLVLISPKVLYLNQK